MSTQQTWGVNPLACLGYPEKGVQGGLYFGMTGMMPHRKPDGSWVYPDSEKVLKAAGLRTIQHYVGVRRATILRYLSERPIYEL